tara:strand:+ start:273 stop:974 length:702 start_codon:yes stop_codon:yes gene_type:complete
MRVALLISGRLKCYETCLIPILQKAPYDIDLFCSINDNESSYYDDVRRKLKLWLKGIEVKPFFLSDRFNEIFVNRHTNLPEPKPYNGMSMFYNDGNGFNMAIDYADKNSFEYDVYMKCRPDMIVDSLPKVTITDQYKIFSVIPWCNHESPVVTRDPVGYGDMVPWVSDVLVYGNKKSMRAYTDSYNFAMEMLELFEGRYGCDFEPTVTQNVYDKSLEVEYFSNPYTLDPTRHQ